jgi:hypothetical protein
MEKFTDESLGRLSEDAPKEGIQLVSFRILKFGGHWVIESDMADWSRQMAFPCYLPRNSHRHSGNRARTSFACFHVQKAMVGRGLLHSKGVPMILRWKAGKLSIEPRKRSNSLGEKGQWFLPATINININMHIHIHMHMHGLLSLPRCIPSAMKVVGKLMLLLILAR